MAVETDVPSPDAGAGDNAAANPTAEPVPSEVAKVQKSGGDDAPAPEAAAAGEPPSKRREVEPPDVPEAYLHFNGRIIEVEASDESAGMAFEELFGRARFEAAFPDAKNLPMPIGLDLEWKPDLKKAGSDNPVALVQLACWDAVLLVHVRVPPREGATVDMPLWLAECLQSPDKVKVTGSFDVSDKAKLRRTFGWDFDARVSQPSCFVDVAELADERGLPRGLKKLASSCGLQMQKQKQVGCSNWAAEGELSSAQRQYAAEDAFFTLYLLGLIYEKSGDVAQEEHSSVDPLLSRALSAWRLMRTCMAGQLQSVDNSKYRRQFFALRDVVKEAVSNLSNAIGSAGSTSLQAILAVKTVANVLKAAQRQCTISVNASFLKMNRDIFIVFWDEGLGELRVRPRRVDEDDEYDEEEETESAFFERVVELLVAYEPPIEKRQSVTHRRIPEPVWVPARAILSKREQARWVAATSRAASVETGSTEDDGVILRLKRHPRAVDSQLHLGACVSQLEKALGLDCAEAERRLRSDEKFADFLGALAIIERGSEEETCAVRSLRARTRILADAQRLADRVSTTWEAAREALEKVKWYRQLLGAVLNPSEDESTVAAPQQELDMEACLDAVVAAWPEVQSVAKPAGKKRGREDGCEGHDAKRAKGGKGKGKGKGKGRSKGR